VSPLNPYLFLPERSHDVVRLPPPRHHSPPAATVRRMESAQPTAAPRACKRPFNPTWGDNSRSARWADRRQLPVDCMPLQRSEAFVPST
jgi:hypothetical protein